MMDKYLNGKKVSVSKEEAERIDKERKEWEAAHPPIPTPEERLTKLEEENAELRTALEILLGNKK